MSSKGKGPVSDTRAVSNLVGIVLLVGMAAFGAVLVVVLGTGAIDEAEQQSRLEVAEQSMLEVSSRLEDLKYGDSSQQSSFRLPENMDGTVAVSNTTRMELLANGRDECTTGAFNVGTIEYQSTGGERIAYEGGGVWRASSPENVWMVSSPAIDYRDGRLGLALSDLQGSVRQEGTISARSEGAVSNRMSRNVSRALFRNLTVAEMQEGKTGHVTCEPDRVTNVTLSIQNSQFAPAWYRYAERHLDQRGVSLEQRGSVGPGDTVNITFELGRTADPEFQVTDIDAPSTANENSDVDIEATIRNVGDFGSTRAVSMSVVDSSATPSRPIGDPYDDERLEIGAGENETVSFTIDASDLDNDPLTYRNYTISVDTPSHQRNASLLVGENTPASLDVTNVDVPDHASLGDDVELDATIENRGDMPTTETIQFWYDGALETEHRVFVDGGDSNTTTFSVPVRKEGGIPLNVTVENPSDSTQYMASSIHIGSLPDFVVDDTDAPETVNESEPFSVEATILNDGRTDGNGWAEIEVRNETTGDTVASENNTYSLSRGADTSVSLSVDGGIDTPGRYEYVVETTNGRTTGNIYVGDVAEAFFSVAEADPSETIREPGDSFDIAAAVVNTGDQTATQSITFEFDGDSYDTEDLTLSAGAERTVTSFQTSIDDDLSAGRYNYTVSSEDTSVSGQIRVVEDIDDIDFDSEETTINVNQSVRARLTILGTELSTMDDAFWPWEDNEINRWPVSMAIYTDNETAPDQYHYVWGDDTDLNRPHRRQDQIDGADYLSQEISVAAGTNLSVFAESYYYGDCEMVDSDIDREVDGETYNSMQCSSLPGSHISINQNENPSNLVILEDGDTVPAYGQASADQRDVRDILGDRISASGELDLESTERVLLYELSVDDANPDNAYLSGDPDYNDAVVLFEVVETRTEITAGTSSFVINDTRGPSTVRPRNTDTFEVDVWNSGQEDGEEHVELWVDGTQEDNVSVDVEASETETVAIDVPNGLSDGNHDVTFKLASDPQNETENRNLYVGDTANPYFLPNVEDVDTVVRPGTTAEIETVVTNVGGSTGTQDVTATVTEGDGSLAGTSIDGETKTWSGVTLDPDDDGTHTFEFTPSESGRMTIEVETENATIERNVTVVEPRFLVNRVVTGDEVHREGETIVSSNLDSVSADVSNPVPISESQDVTFEMDYDNDGSLESVDERSDLKLDGNRTFVDFDLEAGGTDWGNRTGFYDYRISTDDDDLTGRIQITSPADGSDSNESSDLISVDMNKIQLGD